MNPLEHRPFDIILCNLNKLPTTFTGVLMKLMHRLFISCILVIPSVEMLFADSYEADRTHSSVEFSIRHIISTVHGRFNQFGGKMEFDSSDIGKFSIEMT